MLPKEDKNVVQSEALLAFPTHEEIEKNYSNDQADRRSGIKNE